MKFNKYFFENYDLNIPFDENNPRYVLSLEGIDEILSTIATHDPFTLTVDDFHHDHLIQLLLNVDVLQLKDGKLAFNVPIFLDKDYEILKKLSKQVAKKIFKKLNQNKETIEKIISKINNGYSNKRNLYHLLCGSIFDGMMFDYLEEKQLVTTSLIHPSGLDYLVILYEECDSLNKYSNQLLCSYNRMIINHCGFVSFGDSDGNRKDFYRYIRLKELNQLDENQSKYISKQPQDLIEHFNKFIQNQSINQEYLDIYEYFGYIKNNQINVPIYDHVHDIVEELYEIVLSLIKDNLKDALKEIEKTRCTSNKHYVCVKDIANEIYHLIFGSVNEYLVNEGFVENPPYMKDEGRYLKCYEIE